MRNLFTALAFISSVSLSIAGVSANQPYDFGISIVELSDSTTTYNFENKKMELKAELRKKKKKAFAAAGKETLLLAGGLALGALITFSNPSSLNSLFAGVALLYGSVIIFPIIIVVKLIFTLVKNKIGYKRSLKKLSNSLS